MRVVFLCLLLVLIWGCQSTNGQVAQEKIVVGELSSAELLSAYPAFEAEYRAYQPTAAELSAAAKLNGLKVVVLFGTWCHDSEREVPRLLKLFDLVGLSQDNLQLIGVNQNKQEPSGLYRRLDLRFTPTIILFDGDKELGRIIEKPDNNIAQDLAAILAK